MEKHGSDPQVQTIPIVEPSNVVQEYDDEDIFDPDLFRRAEPRTLREIENDLYRDLEARYAQLPVSQADFFTPGELLSDQKQPAKTRVVDPMPEENIPVRSDCPQIRISKPDETSDTSSARVQRPGSAGTSDTSFTSGPTEESRNVTTEKIPGKTVERVRTSLSSLARRHSASDYVWGRNESSRTTQNQADPSWTAKERLPKTGWRRVKIRQVDSYKTKPSVDIVIVYLYDSLACEKTKDTDADLDLFRYYAGASAEKSTPLPEVKILRAQTDISMQSADRPTSPPIFRSGQMSPTSTSDSPKNLTGRTVDWLRDKDMLQAHVKDCRLLTFGFDISAAPSGPSSLEFAAAQLTEYLREIRELHKPPIVFLGHTVGGLIILRSLMHSSEHHAGEERLQSHTAGVLLLSCPIIPAKGHAQEVVNSLGMENSAKLNQIFYGSTMAIDLPQLLRSGLLSVKSSDARSLIDLPHAPIARPRRRDITIGFPIVQMLLPGEPMASDLSKFNGAQVEVVVLLKKTLGDALRFRSPIDNGFQRVVGIVKTFLRKRRMFLAIAAGSVEQVEALLQDGIDPNMGDRWNQTPLHMAVRLGHEHLVHRLLRLERIRVNAGDLRLNTPLHYAIRTGNETIVTTLLHHGADAELRNAQKRTCRDLAEAKNSRKHIAKLLRSQLVKGPDTRFVAKCMGDGQMPKSNQGQMACRNYQITVTEIYASETSDTHWSVTISVASLLYGDTPIDEILHQVRPRSVQHQVPICTWIHVPENNMIWIEQLFQKLRLHAAIWQDTRQSITYSLRNRAITPHFAQDRLYSVFLPFLSYEANHRQIKRAEHIQLVNEEHKLAKLSVPHNAPEDADPEEMFESPTSPFTKQLRPWHEDSDSEPDVDDNVAVDNADLLDEEERALISSYLNRPPALHVRRTLDQYYYHMLESTKDRDSDQVVSRWAMAGNPDARHNILMVDQLWLWAMRPIPRRSYAVKEMPKGLSPEESDEIQRKNELARRNNQCYVISSFPSRTGVGHGFQRTQDDLRSLVLDATDRKRDPIEQHADLVSRILETCCGIFDRLQDVESLRFFQMFEESISKVDDRESVLFRNFQHESTRLFELSPSNKYYDKRKSKLLKSMLDIREEIKMLVEIKDIRDEINIIVSVLHIQKSLIDHMSQENQVGYALLQGSAVEEIVEKDIDDFMTMDEQAKSIQEKLNTLMDLKQKAANAWEAREARETAVAASKQGNIVLVFTIVTIVFLPLSFMSSFFTIGVSAFPKDPTSGETSWPIHLVTAILFGVSLSVSIPLIAFALNMDAFNNLWNDIRFNHLARTCIWVLRFWPRQGRHAAPQRWTRKLGELRAKYMQVEPEDKTHEDGEFRAKRLARAMRAASMGRKSGEWRSAGEGRGGKGMAFKERWRRGGKGAGRMGKERKETDSLV